MTNTKPLKPLNARRLGNNLKSYFSKPANVITIVFLVILILAVVIPLLTVVLGSFQVNTDSEGRYIGGLSEGDWTLHHWTELLTSKEADWAWLKLWKPLLESTGMALLACLIAVVFGGVVAWFITRSDLPCKKFISAVFVFPYIMPSWSIAMFWQNFFKNTGYADTKIDDMGLLQMLTGACVPKGWVYGLIPCAICLGLHYAPFAYILIGGILRNMDANLEEAATVLKASRFKILYKITLPIVAPALLSTVLLVFSSSISSYTVPFMLGDDGGFTAFSIQMKNLINDNMFKGQGYVMAIILMLFSIAILTLNNWFTGKRKSFTTVTGKSGQVSLVKLGKARIAIAVILVILVAFFAIVPLVSFAAESVLEPSNNGVREFTWKYWFSSEPTEGSTKGDTIGILASTTMWKAFGGSLLLSLVVAFIAGTAGILIGYAVARKRGSRAASMVSNLAFFPYLIPSMSFGAVYLALSLTKGFTWLQGTFILLILVGAVKFMPFASRTGTNAMMQLSGEIEEAAIMLNVPWHKRMTRVLFPIQKSSFISGYLLPFVSCMRELSLFVLLAKSHETLLTTLMGEYQRTGLTQTSNAVNLLIIVTVLIIQFITNKLTGASIDKGVGG